MCVRIRVMAAVAIAAMMLLGIATAASAITCNFESGVGHNGSVIGSSIGGLVFSTVNGPGMCYASIDTGWYSVTSDNGRAYHDGEYFMSGNAAAYLSDLTDKGKVSFAYGPASFFSVGYSSENLFVVEAYNSLGTLLTSASGGANVKSQGGTGLQYLTVSHSDIAYVVLHDDGGYWMVDNITTDAPVPEPSSLLLLGSGFVCLIARRRRK
jgi:hypothetical protein